MKKLVILIGIVVLSMNVFSQNKGDMYILTSATASFGQMHGSMYNPINGVLVSSIDEPLDTYLELGTGFGYFAANNFRLEICLSAYYEKDPREKASGDLWLSNKYKALCVCPNLSYYVRLADKFYYTPEVGVSIDFGMYSYDKTVSKTLDYPYRGYALYADLLSFMYRVGPHFAICAGVGELRYNHRNYYEDGDMFYSGSTTAFYLNNATISAQIYL